MIEISKYSFTTSVYVSFNFESQDKKCCFMDCVSTFIVCNADKITSGETEQLYYTKKEKQTQSKENTLRTMSVPVLQKSDS